MNGNPQRAEAKRVEVLITQADGSVIRWVCDDFDYLDIDKMNEPQYFTGDYFLQPLNAPQVASLSFTLQRPRRWTVYHPSIQPAVDDGNVVEEGI